MNIRHPPLGEFLIAVQQLFRNEKVRHQSQLESVLGQPSKRRSPISIRVEQQIAKAMSEYNDASKLEWGGWGGEQIEEKQN